MAADAFFVPDGSSDRGRAFVSTDHTRGPWDPDAQHGGPPSALVGHVLATDHPREDAVWARVTIEILRPVPVGRLHVSTEVLRAGRKVELLGAAVVDDAGTPVLRASAWRIRTADVPLDAGVEGTPIAGPDEAAEPEGFFRELGYTGFVEAVETRFVTGSWTEPGPAIAWMRMRHQLVEAAPTGPLERVLLAADSGNGISSRFGGLFINPDLTVYQTRPAVGEWVGLAAHTTLTDHGVGLAQSVLHDREGPLGRGLQSLLLDRPA